MMLNLKLTAFILKYMMEIVLIFFYVLMEVSVFGMDMDFHPFKLESILKLLVPLAFVLVFYFFHLFFNACNELTRLKIEKADSAKEEK